MSLFGRLIVRIPRAALAAFGAVLGWLIWALGIRRKVVLANLRLAFPEKTEAERRDIARRTYLNLGQLVPEFLRIPSLPREELERIFVYDGWENFEKARAFGKGVIAATGHFGNFEVLAAAHTLRGVPITMISRQMGKSAVNDVWRKVRLHSGVEDLVVAKGQTLSAAIRSLKSGRVLGYVIDQHEPHRRAIFPTFFGVPAATSATPAVVAMRTGAAVIFILSVPLEDGRHRVVIEGPLFPPDTGDRDRDALLFMQDLNDRLERHVRAHPDRWYWLHRRWKSRGPGAAPPPEPPAELTRADGAG
jgi:KDO2-lipid IV(A) lauroyltransferase